MARGRLGALAALLAAALAACGTVAGPRSTGPSVPTRTTTAVQPAPRRAGAHYDHVIVVVMENLSYASALETPGFAALAHRFAYDSDAYGVSHPSLPNYLALAGGSTFGITSDCTACYVDADNLGAQLSDAHLSWDDFNEGLPSACFLGPYAGEYAGKHDPFRYFVDVRRSESLCAHLVGLAPLLADLRRGPSALPQFSFVTPNLCHDGHDCAPDVAAAWLTGFLGDVTTSRAWSQHTLVVVTWDESYDSDTASIAPDGRVAPTGGGGHILTLLCAKGIPRGADVATPLNQEGILAFVEQDLSLPLLAGARAWRGHTLTLP